MTKERKVWTTSTPPKLKEDFDKLASDTRLNKNDLIAEAIEDLLKKYETKIELYRK